MTDTSVRSNSALNSDPLEWSILIPFYGSGDTIERCVESVLALRTEHSFEVVLIDNASPDDSRQRIEQYEHLAQVRILREEQAGAYAARNAGLSIARGRRIAFTDADCEVHPQWLQAAQAALDADGVGAVIGHCRYPDSASLRLRLLERYENTKAAYVTEQAPAHWFAYANNLAIRAELFGRIGAFKQWARAADSEFVHRMATITDLRLAFEPAMQVTHLEFVQARNRLARLRLYGGTNAQIATFRELSAVQRFAIVRRAMFGR